jgi:hypothetical protein
LTRFPRGLGLAKNDDVPTPYRRLKAEPLYLLRPTTVEMEPVSTEESLRRNGSESDRAIL